MDHRPFFKPNYYITRFIHKRQANIVIHLKKVVVIQERERHQPPVVKRIQPRPGKELVIKVRAKKPGVVKVAVKRDSAPQPAPKHYERVMPQDEPGRR